MSDNLDIIDPNTLDSIDSADGVSPDGGICFITGKDGFKHIILVSEAKHQGRHDGYTPISDSGWLKECAKNPKLDPNLPIEERPKQANGNAIERAFKNSNTFQGLTSIYGYFPYVIFCDGFDFRTKDEYNLFSHQKFASRYNTDSPIRMRLVSGNYFMPLNNSYVLGAKRGFSTVYPASIYARMKKWEYQEMVDVFLGVMIQSINHLESIGKIVADRFAQYGLASLGAKVLELARAGYTEATITLELQNTDEYKTRFAANADRIKKGLAVLTPAEYLSVEDGYRQTLRAYGLKQFDNDAYVRQFIANDVSPSELSTRVVTAVQRVQNSDPVIARTLRDYYGIGDVDMVAYVLDPNNQLPMIQRQVAAAEIGSAARLQGLEAGVSVSEQLAAQGITQAEAQKGYATIADILPTAEKLSSIYGNQLEGYNQAEAEQEVFNTLASAQRKRRALVERETGTFSGRSGTSRASLTSGPGGQI